MEAFVGSFTGVAVTAQPDVRTRRASPRVTTMQVKVGGGAVGGGAVGGGAVGGGANINTGSGASLFKVPSFVSPDTYDARSRNYDFQRRAAGTGETIFDIRLGNDGLRKHANSRANDIKTFRNMDPYTDDLVWVRDGKGTPEAVTAAIKQVFGNAHLFESETLEFDAAISTFLDCGNVKEFVRALGQSEAYKTRFFDAVTPMRAVELNFKHFMGRAPRSQAEYAAHMAIMQKEGFSADINSYLDSPEYDSLYSTTRVPAINFRGGHETNAEMNAIAILNGPNCSSDKSQTTAPMFPVFDGKTGVLGFTVKKGLPPAWVGENKARAKAGLSFKPPGAAVLPAELAADAAQWKAKLGSWTKYYYADSLPYEEIFTPVTKHSDEEEEDAAAVLKYGSLMAKSYTGGARKNFDYAPIIALSSPGPDESGGSIRVVSEKIETPIPMELKQEV